MSSYLAIGNAAVLVLNMLHTFLYLDPKRHARWRVVFGVLLVSLPMFLVRPENLPNLTALLVGPATVFLGGLVYRHLIFEGSYGRMLACMFAVGSFTHILIIASYLFLHYGMRAPVDAALYVDARLCSVALYIPCLLLLRKYARKPFRTILNGLETQHWYAAVGAPLFIFMLGILTHAVFFHHTGNLTLALALVTIGIVAAFYWSLHFATAQADRNRFLADALESAGKMAGIYESYNALLDGKEMVLRTLRHDFRHALIVLGDLAEQGDTEGIVRQLRLLDVAPGETAATVHSENVPIKAILSFYFSRAVELGVKCTSSVDLPPKAPVPEAELVMLVGNALENCLKAAAPLGAEGFIDVTIGQVRGCLAFRFRNNFRSGEYAKGSGLGLVSIRMLCDKYNGNLEIREEKGEFELTAVLQVGRVMPTAGDA